MHIKIPSTIMFALSFASLAACESNLDVDEEVALLDDLDDADDVDLQSPEAVIAALTGACDASSPACALALDSQELSSGADELVLLDGSCAANAPYPCSALSLFDGDDATTSHLKSLDDHPGTITYPNNPPNNQPKHWIMGDWNADGLDSPGYLTAANKFRYTNTPASPALSWSALISLVDGYALVAGRFLANYANDCVGVITTPGTNLNQDTIWVLEYWCDFSNMPAPGSHGTQWLGAILPDSTFPAGAHEFVAGDWDGDGIDEIAIRKDQFISYNLVDPAASPAAFAQAQRWGVPPGELAETGVFVSGDWNGDGTDGWGVLYDDNHFFYRNNLAWNPGADAYYLQHIDNLFTKRSVSSHQLDLQ